MLRKESIPIYLTHNDGSFYGQLQVSQGLSHQGYDALHAVNLLSQKDVHGRQSSHFLKSRSHLYVQTENVKMFLISLNNG